MTCATKHAVLLVEGNAKVSAALHTVLEREPDLELIGETANGSEMLTLIEGLRPDIILLSHALFGPHLLETIEIITGRFPFIRVLVLSSHNDSRLAVRAFAAGAAGYMLKDRANEELSDAVETIVSNRTYLSPGIAGMGRVIRKKNGAADVAFLDSGNDPFGEKDRRELPHVLVVDDEQAIRDAFRSTFERAGYTVTSAATGEEAIAALRREPPDIAFVDLVMPGTSGVQVIRAIHDIDETLPVVIVTGYPDSELMHQALAYSPLVILAKPVQTKALLDTARNILLGRQASSSGSRQGTSSIGHRGTSNEHP